jgi:SAM-dependent methyltransferase
MSNLPSPTASVGSPLPAELMARTDREKCAHENDHIDKAGRRWWRLFPHVFDNPSMKQLNLYSELELGGIQEKVVLELGCGNGGFASWLMSRGARVVGIDISEFNISRCNAYFSEQALNTDRYKFYVMDAHRLAFPSSSFDFVIGNGVIHHLDLAVAMSNIDRVLKPGGKALFQEPLRDNPLLLIYRRLSQFHTTDEKPLGRHDIDYFITKWGARAKFSGLVTLPAAIVTSIILRPFPNNWLLRVAAVIEDEINRRHIMDHWNRFVVLVYEKRAQS